MKKKLVQGKEGMFQHFEFAFPSTFSISLLFFSYFQKLLKNIFSTLFRSTPSITIYQGEKIRPMCKIEIQTVKNWHNNHFTSELTIFVRFVAVNYTQWAPNFSRWLTWELHNIMSFFFFCNIQYKFQLTNPQVLRTGQLDLLWKK